MIYYVKRVTKYKHLFNLYCSEINFIKIAIQSKKNANKHLSRRIILKLNLSEPFNNFEIFCRRTPSRQTRLVLIIERVCLKEL